MNYPANTFRTVPETVVSIVTLPETELTPTTSQEDTNPPLWLYIRIQEPPQSSYSSVVVRKAGSKENAAVANVKNISPPKTCQESAELTGIQWIASCHVQDLKIPWKKGTTPAFGNRSPCYNPMSYGNYYYPSAESFSYKTFVVFVT